MEKTDLPPHEKIYRSRRQMMLENFLGGVAWSLGTIFGASIILTIIGLFLSRIDLIPIFGSWLSQIIQSMDIQTKTIIR